MADNALANLFQEQANALRAGLGDIGLIKPIDFPARTMDLVSMLGSGGTGDPESGTQTIATKVSNGSFNTGASDTGGRWIDHNLGVVPDLVIVRQSSTNAPVPEAMADKSPIVAILGSSRKIPISGYIVMFGESISLAGKLTENVWDLAYMRDYHAAVYADENRFHVGVDDDGSGTYQFLPNTNYSWSAIALQSSQIAHTVTFMSHDGSTVLYERSVVDGDNCADPVARGYIDAPTKESTNSQNFEFAGWSATPGGSADASILNAVTGSKTVYAAFTASTRYYTIRFFDGDTLLHTVLGEYGSTPSYTAEKNGYGFGGWSPVVVAVTGDADYQAIWVEKVTFANASWAQIAEISAKGEARNNFAIGDTKTFTFGSETLTCEIVGFDHDDLADGSGKAGITIMTKTLSANVRKAYTTIRTGLTSDYTNLMPTELKNVVKSVNKLLDASINQSGGTKIVAMNFWIPSVQEMDLADREQVYSMVNILGEPYELYKTYTSENTYQWRRYTPNSTTTREYMLRNYQGNGSSKCLVYNGQYAKVQSSSQTSNDNILYTLFGFCI